MEAKKETPPSILDQLKEYAETRIKLAKYEAIEGGTSLIASLIADIVIVFSATLAFIFASITIAFFLGDVLGAYWRGFGCVAILYVAIVLLIKYNRQRLEIPITNTLIQKLFKSK